VSIVTGAGYIIKTQDYRVEGSNLGSIMKNYQDEAIVDMVKFKEKMAGWLGLINVARVRGNMVKPVGMLTDCEQSDDLEHMWRPTLAAAKDLTRKSLVMICLLSVLGTA
jgi:hypothetical protein